MIWLIFGEIYAAPKNHFLMESPWRGPASKGQTLCVREEQRVEAFMIM